MSRPADGETVATRTPDREKEDAVSRMPRGLAEPRRRRIRARLLPLATAAAVAAGCGGEDPAGPSADPFDSVEDVLASEQVTRNPHGVTPLAARIDIETLAPVSIGLRVEGRNGADSDVVREPSGVATSHSLPVLGLYPDHDNSVVLTFRSEGGEELGTRTYTIPTPPLSEHMPSITIDRATPSAMAEGMTLVSYYGHGGDPRPNRAFMFDRHGDIRWVLDFDVSNVLGGLAFGDGVHRLRNGHLYFGDGTDDRIYQVSMLGEIVDTWEMPGFAFHHEVTEKPDGNFLVSVTKDGIATIEDHLIEIDRASGEIVNVWDLRQSLDYDRTTWTDDRTDWVHVNAVTWDERDGTVIVSGRTQGVVKLTEDNEVVWILGPHRGWGTAGDGTDLESFLLQPLDASGAAITDSAVLLGDANHPDFQWNWYQHAPVVTPEGNVLLFDNGDNRNYTGNELYSRAVEYDIDPEAMTVRQVLSYGEGRGQETFSRIVSDVDHGTDRGHVFFSPGAVEVGGDAYGKVIELGPDGDEVLFEATVTPPMPLFIITFHRTQRMPLYPGG